MKNNQKGGVGVVVLIVIAIIALGGIWHGVSKSKVAVNPNSGSVANIPAGWKTYKNDKYGFEIMHPGDSLVGMEGISKYNPVEFQVIFQDKNNLGANVGINIQKLSFIDPNGNKSPYTNVTSIDEYKNFIDESCNGKEMQKAREDYKKGLIYITPGHCSEINDFVTQGDTKGIVWTRTAEGGSSYLIEFIKNGFLYTIGSSAAPIGDEELVNQIAKTFRFTK